MGLQVWLPLNGSLENRGLSNTTLGGTYSPTYIDGKIGKCMNCSTTVKLTPSTPMKSTKYSFAAWIKSATVTSSSTVWWKIFRMNYSDSTYHTLYTADSGSGRYKMEYNPEYNVYCDTQVWQHLVFTIDGAKITAYLNGILVGSSTGSNAERTLSSIEVGGNANVWLNDVRVYDHILSPKEVKEISKALCLHYTLNNNGGGGDNILLGTNQGISNWTWGMQAGDVIRTEVIMDGVKCCKFTRGSTAQSGWSYLFYSALNYSAYKPNTVYTISMDVYPSVDTSFSFSNFMQGNATAGMLTNIKTLQGSVKANQWNKLIFQGTTLETLPASSSQGVYFTVANKNTGISYIFRNIKVEEGPTATQWIPNKADTLYSQAGFGDKIEYDTSGYRNNGTIVGTIPCTSDTPRYSASMTFDGNCANYIKSTTPLNFLTKTLTVSCWIYQTATSATSGSNTSSNLFIVSNGRDYEHYGFGLRSSSGTPTFIIGGGTTGNITVSSGVNTMNGWHMVTGTWDGATAKIYIDGVLKASKACTGVDYTHAGGAFVVGKMSYGHTSTTTHFPFPGKISDVRVYATALSEADILELYNAPIAVDNGAAMYAMELKEVY